MTHTRQDPPDKETSGMTVGQIEEIRSNLRQRKSGLLVNQAILFKYTAALPLAKRTGLYIAGWGPVVLFPAGLALYFFVDWKIALFTIFLSLFWVGMGRRFAQMVIKKQCFDDSAFLKFALSVELVRIV